MVRRAHGSGRAAVYHSMPFAWGIGGLLADGPVSADLISLVVDDLVSSRPLRVHLRPNPLQAEEWATAMAGRPDVVVRPARAHVLDLSGGFDEVWRTRFRPTTRTQVRRAQNMGVEVVTDTTGRLVPEFYELLRRSTDRWARRQHEPLALARLRRARRDPVEKFEAIAAFLGEACQISVARFQGRPAAAILVLRGRNAQYTRGAMDESLAGPLQANRLLHKTAIEAACRAGCASYHMGESGASDGLSQFKSRFGAQPHPYAEYWIERLPLTRADQSVRRAAKRVVGFREDGR